MIINIHQGNGRDTDWPSEALCSWVVRSFVCLIICYQTCEHKILKSGLLRKGMKLSSLVVRRSKVKVTRGRRQICRPGGGIILDSLGVALVSVIFCCLAALLVCFSCVRLCVVVNWLPIIFCFVALSDSTTKCSSVSITVRWTSVTLRRLSSTPPPM